MKIKAIALGVVTDLTASVIVAIPIGVIGAVLHVSRGGKLDTFETFLHGHIPLMMFSLFLGLAAVLAGGVVTARVAKQDRVWNAFLMGVVTTLIGIPFSLSLPLWFNVASFLLMVPCAMLGGWLVERRQRNQPSPPPLPCAPAGLSGSEGCRSPDEE
jgi:hypothetical protein